MRGEQKGRGDKNPEARTGGREVSWRDEHNRQETGKRAKRTNARGRVFIWVSHRGKGREAVIRKTNNFIHKT